MNNKKIMVICTLLLLVLVLSGCTKSTSIVLQVQNHILTIEGFGRGQSLLGMQCIACPHVGAKIEVRSQNNELICKGSNEIIVSDTSKVRFTVGCPGLEDYENQTVKIIGEGFTGGKVEEVREFKINEEKVVQFEKI